MAVATFIGWFIGDRLDSYAGTAPYLTIAFLVIGSAAGFRGLIRAARQAQREDRANTTTPDI